MRTEVTTPLRGTLPSTVILVKLDGPAHVLSGTWIDGGTYRISAKIHHCVELTDVVVMSINSTQ